jgi:hypothetical protein
MGMGLFVKLIPPLGALSLVIALLILSARGGLYA